MKNNSSNEIRVLISSVLGISLDALTDDAGIDHTPGWDSLKHMEVILAAESYFQVQFTAEEMMEMTSLDHIVLAIERRLA